MKVTILQIGQVGVEALQFIREELKKIFPKTEISILETVMPIPKESYDSFRRQYNSTHILAKAGRFVKEVETDHVIGVTDVDLYVPNLNFVFGEAECPGKIAVMSLFRLKPEFYRKPSNYQLFLERALKETVHEIGHTLGLRHCQNPLCVMFFSNSIEMTDTKKHEFCEKCRQKSFQNVRRICTKNKLILCCNLLFNLNWY